MKTYKKTLYYKEYTAPIAYGYKPEHQVQAYVKIEVRFNFKEGLWFSTTIPNCAYGDRNIFKSIFRALEHESIGMAKYNRIKEDTRKHGLWQKLDC